jgi:hypothetical protein
MLALERVPPAMIRFAAAVAAILALASCASPAPSNPTVSTASPMRSPSGTPPVETLLCEHYEGLLPSGVDRDSCPPAIAAVRAVVASLDLPVVRIVIEPGVFLCDDPWPMPGSSVACLSPSLLAGTTMRGWVTFQRVREGRGGDTQLRRSAERRAKSDVDGHHRGIRRPAGRLGHALIRALHGTIRVRQVTLGLRAPTAVSSQMSLAIQSEALAGYRKPSVWTPVRPAR